MGHIQKIHLENFRSFMDAECRLSPLTLVVGRNNCGKSNFLKAFQAYAYQCAPLRHMVGADLGREAHYQHDGSDSAYTVVGLEWPDQSMSFASSSEVADWPTQSLTTPEIFTFEPAVIGAPEPTEIAEGVNPRVLPDGKGVTSVLRMLVQGSSALRSKFDLIEHQWQQCLPEIVSLHLPATGPSRLMVEQKNIPGSQPISDLSEGARLILAILTLVHQATPPPLILLEDLDHRLHPRLFSTLIRILRDLTRTGAVGQIIATTHNPYLVDEFIEEPESVVIVEKMGGRSTLANMDDRLKTFVDANESLDMPLGQVWFSGLADAPRPMPISQ